MTLKIIEKNDIIAVKLINKMHALMLFKKKLEMQVESKDVIELTAALEFMLLAIMQAAVYIKQRTPHCSVQQYIKEF